jgi:transcriptional regulator with XRE-family HTH domain
MARVAYIFGKRLAEARDQVSMTQRELGEAIGGVSDETISRVERHEVAGILAKRLPKLASALGMTLEQFKAGYCPPDPPKTLARFSPGGSTGHGAAKGKNDPSSSRPGAGLPQGLDMRRSHPARTLPEFQIGISATRRVDKLAEYPDAMRLAATTDRRAFTAPVDGDCQHPKWKHGEVVVFSYEAFEREGIIPGKSYYIAFTDGTTTFKRVFRDEKDPEVYILRCWNRKKYPADQRVHHSEVVRIARAVSKQVMVEENEE